MQVRRVLGQFCSKMDIQLHSSVRLEDPKNRGLSTYKKECLAILYAVDHWHPIYNMGCFSSRWIRRSYSFNWTTALNATQQKALTKLMHLQFQIQYKKGLDNRCADVLSRRPDMQLYQAHL
jgi:hypothetical protein